MANINVNRTSTDTHDNIKYTTPVNNIDYKGITLLIGVVFLALTALWLMSLGLAAFSCWYVSSFNCNAATYIFWGYIILIFISVATAIVTSIPAIITGVENMKYRTWRGVITHRDELRTFAADIIGVARESAHSEATAGMDNYSPSIDNSNKSTAPAIPDVEIQPFSDLVIAPVSYDESEK